jgi:hypothetical protein
VRGLRRSRDSRSAGKELALLSRHTRRGTGESTRPRSADSDRNPRWDRINLVNIEVDQIGNGKDAGEMYEKYLENNMQNLNYLRYVLGEFKKSFRFTKLRIGSFSTLTILLNNTEGKFLHN